MVVDEFLEKGYPLKTLLKLVNLPRSSYYYVAKETKQGRKAAKLIYTNNGEQICFEKVIEDIKVLLAGEFVDYGYYKVYVHLKKTLGYQIGSSRTYKLMKDSHLLKFERSKIKKNNRNWVKDLVPKPLVEFSFLEFDIKYIYVAGKRTNAQVLTVIDVYSRWVLGHYINWKIGYQDVIDLFKVIILKYPMAKNFIVRNDNGSQFEASMVQSFLVSQGITQEFTKPATPQQNAHIESYHSIMESAVCQRIELDDLKHAREVMERFKTFYNFDRIHGGIGYQSPYKYLLQKGTDMKSAPFVKSA
jgi:putative transposase